MLRHDEKIQTFSFFFLNQNCASILNKKHAIFMTLHGFEISNSCHCRVFLTKYGWCNNPRVRNKQQFKSKHTFTFIELHDFIWLLISFWNVFIVCVAPKEMNLNNFYSQKIDKNIAWLSNLYWTIFNQQFKFYLNPL